MKGDRQVKDYADQQVRGNPDHHLFGYQALLCGGNQEKRSKPQGCQQKGFIFAHICPFLLFFTLLYHKYFF
jgi:hypothetical protein